MSFAGNSSLWEQGEDHTVEVNQRALIDKILARYSGEYTIFRELLQNADDANAQSVKIRFYTKEGLDRPGVTERELPDLLKVPIYRYVVENDGIPFRDQDWVRLRKIAEGNPDDDKIGAFGVGFYALFSITESPLVESGTKWMGFHWKNGGDQLFARSGVLPEMSREALGGGEGEGSGTGTLTGNPWTRFSMDMRNVSPIEGPLDFAKFLVQSLTFMSKMRDIKMFVDDWQVLHLQKEVGIQDEQVNLSRYPKQRSGQGPVSPAKVMHIEGLTSTNVKITTTCMQWLQEVGFQNVAPLPAIQTQAVAKAKTAASGLSAMFSSVFSRSMAAATPTPVARPVTPVQELPTKKKDPREMKTASMMLQIYRADVRVTVTRDLERELERATKKAPPKRTSLQLIYSSPEEEESEEEKADGGGSSGGIFAGLKPENGGRIFIGQATGQTTGLGGHIAARFIPTVERESIDLMDRFVSVWNRELLYVGGYVARLVYEVQMTSLREKWPPTSGKAITSDDPATKWLEKTATHAMKYFTFKPSTPSNMVSSLMEAAFFSSLGDTTMPVISTKGVLGAETVRMPDAALLKFLPNMLVIPEAVATEASNFVARLTERRIMKIATIEDIVRELGASPLSEDQAVALIEWWKKLINLPQYNGAIRAQLLEATIVTLLDEETKVEKVVPLETIETYLNPSNIPSDMPLPLHTLPYSLSKRLIANDLRFVFDWHELTLPEWLQSLSPSRFTAGLEKAEQILGVVGRAWPRLSNPHKEEIKGILGNMTCIPTKLGYKKPAEAYFIEVSVFEDLPVIEFPHLAVKGSIRNMLEYLGVRSVVDLQLIFTRLIGKSVWSCHDLAKYLASVRKSLSDLEMARLKKTAAFPIWDPTQNPDEPAKAVKRATPDGLCEPSAENKALGVNVLDYGSHAWKPSSVEAAFLYELGLKRHANVADVVKLAASADADASGKALQYLLRHIRHYNGFSAPAQFPDIAFIPATKDGKQMLAKPNAAFINSACSVIGCAVVTGLSPEDTGKLRLQQDPPVDILVNYLIQTPPRTVEQGKSVFEYMTSRILDLQRTGSISRIQNSAFIPTESGRMVAPSQTFFVPREGHSEAYQLYKDIYNFVDFGNGNPFLETCGVKNQPTQEQVARMIVNDPFTALERLASAEKYQNQLRHLAAGFATLPMDLRRQMAKAPFLLAVKRSLPAAQKVKKRQSIDDDDDNYLVYEKVLAKASDICLIDDPNLSRIFAQDFLAAPEETLLEDLYAKLGVKPLSSYIKSEHRNVGSTGGVTDTAARLRKLVVERLALFLAERRSQSRYDMDWLRGEDKSGENLQVVEVDELQLKQTLKINQTERSEIQPVSAAVIKTAGTKIKLYISARMSLDLFEVALALCPVLLTKTRNEDVLVLHTILEASLSMLRRRGYNVDRILNQHKIEKLAREAEERQRAAVAEKSTRQASDKGTLNATTSVSDKRTSSDFDAESMASQPETSNDAMSIRSKDGNRLTSQGIMNQLRGKFRRGSNGSMAGPMVPNNSITQHPLGPNQSKEVTPASAIRDGAMRAIAASRPSASKSDIISEPASTMVKESADTYCDNTGVKTNLTPAGMVPGTDIGFFVDRTMTLDTTSLQGHHAVASRFAQSILIPLASVFKLETRTLHIFCDTAGPLIAFNKSGALYANVRYYAAWHDRQVMAGNKHQAYTSWFLTLAHECAHNVVQNHDSQHEFWTSSIIETLMDDFVKLLNTRA